MASGKKEKFILITHEGSKLVKTIEEAKIFVEIIEDEEVYLFQPVYLTQKEFQDLPEFQGF